VFLQLDAVCGHTAYIFGFATEVCQNRFPLLKLELIRESNPHRQVAIQNRAGTIIGVHHVLLRPKCVESALKLCPNLTKVTLQLLTGRLGPAICSMEELAGQFPIWLQGCRHLKTLEVIFVFCLFTPSTIPPPLGPPGIGFSTAFMLHMPVFDGPARLSDTVNKILTKSGYMGIKVYESSLPGSQIRTEHWRWTAKPGQSMDWAFGNSWEPLTWNFWDSRERLVEEKEQLLIYPAQP
jgi:hypothetical protein